MLISTPTFPHLAPKTLLFKQSLISSSCSVTALQSASSILTPNSNLIPNLSYGPSLHKGWLPLPQNTPNHPLAPSNTLNGAQQRNLEEDGTVNSEEDDKDYLFDECKFTRVFNIAAIRVPSAECFSLENRLRGHLLNWPRIRNIARVPGDEMEEELAKLMKRDGGEVSSVLVSLDRRLYGKADEDGERLSPILYREKLVKSFNSRGFAKFKNVAKLSRPKKPKKKKNRKEESGIGKTVYKKSEVAVVESVKNENQGANLSRLLGDNFKGGMWKGPTRLLLLDERLADRGIDELPEAIKALLNDGTEHCQMPKYELVRCNLTLFYNYWLMNEILEALIPNGVIIPSAYEIVGHIVHLNLRDEHLPFKKLIAKVVLDKNRPKIQTVVNKVAAIHNNYRTMPLEVLAGNHSLVTTVVESGMRFHVDLATVYWNSRLASERQRLIYLFSHEDIVCDVFSGVGPLAISAAKKVKCVYANDLNPYAVEYLERNCVFNKIQRKIQVVNMDGRRFIDFVFANENANLITQVVMNLPNNAAEFLDAFRGIYKNTSSHREHIFPRIHVYGFSKAKDPEFDFHERIRIGLSEVGVDVEMHRVRLVAPGKWLLCASFTLPRSVAFRRKKNVEL